MKETLCLAILLSCSPLSSGLPDEFIVWNVGQGQWTTLSTPDKCVHFDFGGEREPQKVVQTCHSKQNILNISHWDWDHLSFLDKVIKKFRHFCLVQLPVGKAPSRKKALLFKNIPICPSDAGKDAKELTSRLECKNSNDCSRSLVVRQQILVPGDAPISRENTWPLKNLKQVRFLVAGHHGSRTSSGQRLLSKLPNLSFAVSTARQKKYGHPHQVTVRRFQRFGIPILKTEDWGNIRWPLTP